MQFALKQNKETLGFSRKTKEDRKTKQKKGVKLLLTVGAFLLTVGAFLLTLELFCLQFVDVLIRYTFPL